MSTVADREALLAAIPEPPQWRLDWPALSGRFDWVAAMSECEQDPGYHAEGNVGIHTEMVLQELAAAPRFRALDPSDRRAAFLACLLHDVAKPLCTRLDDGRLTSRGHSTRGEIMTRRLLWQMGVDPTLRETVAALVRHHQIPFFLLESDDPRRRLYRISQSTRCDLLGLVAWADGAGRRCADPGDRERLLEACDLFVEYAAEQACLDRPRAFASDHSRFLYFRKERRDPDYHAHEDTRSEATIVCGLPASGKDHWIATHAPNVECISLDAIRARLGVDPRDPQGRVIADAREQARVALRAGAPLVWNATNLGRDLRSRVIDLCADYNARVRVVYVETDPTTLSRRNQARERPVPAKAITRMLESWTIADRGDCHELVFDINR